MFWELWAPLIVTAVLFGFVVLLVYDELHNDDGRMRP